MCRPCLFYYEAMSSLRVSVRGAAICLGFSALLVAVTLPWHPSIFAYPVDEVVRGFAAWTALHAIATLALILAVVGASGLVAVHDGRLGRLGSLGLIITVVGSVGATSVLGIEAIVFPILAERAPELLALDGPPLTSPLFIGAGLCAHGWPLGLAVRGSSCPTGPRLPAVAWPIARVERPGLSRLGRAVCARCRSAVCDHFRAYSSVVGLADVEGCGRAKPEAVTHSV
jgi:hypothetical protein